MKAYGIADAHGLESFIEGEPEKADPGLITFLVLRANANRQRHAIMYVAEMDEETVRVFVS